MLDFRPGGLKLFKKADSRKFFIEYMQEVFNAAFLCSDDLSLFLMGQFNYKGEDQIENLTKALSTGNYELCSGYHDSNSMKDLLIVYLAIWPGGCKLLIVLDPFELYYNASLLHSIEVDDCRRALKATVQKSL